MRDGQVEQRRLTFGRVAELYEHVRPSYPPELVDEVAAYAPLGPGDRILDVGAGTGKATRLFAGRGQEVVALEPSDEMAAVARETLGGLADTSVVQAEFEHWDPPPDRFKLLISAQAWHWIDREARYVKARAALVEGGALAAFWNYADWRSSPLRPALDEAYRRAAPDFPPAGPMHPLVHEDLVPTSGWAAEVAASDGFARPELRRFPWRQRYGTDEYVRLLSTHSDHAVLAPAIRERLLARVADAIDAHGGEFELAYVTHLCLARAV
jgi:SAM-dependent methyltransferase